MPKATARQRVFAYLRKHRRASAAQIGRALKMTSPAVRHHLAILQADGFIFVAGTAPGGRRGRPVKLFGVSPRLIADNVPALLHVALNEGMTGLPPAQQAAVMSRLASALLAASADDFAGPLTRRLAQAIARLNAMNYEARWEAGPEGPRILFGACPYAAVIAQHPELCQMDRAMLERLTQLPAEQRAKIGSANSAHCKFQLG